ncbi:MAG: sulfotransferase domain-containing protein [Alphaproteobacteria bacterium]|nr:sulfotransferase domain-containing protein [Alphaproteobacteria bacterium]
MRIANLFCVGAQKAGTSTLANILADHRDIFMPAGKEVHYFDNHELFARGHSWYEQQFSDASGERYIADFTPDYLHLDYAPQRLLETCGRDVKLLISLRQPVSRAFSQFHFYRQLGVEPRDDFQAVLAEDILQSDAGRFNSWHDPAHYITRSRYFDGVNAYQQLFGRGNVLVVLFERLIDEESRAAELSRIYDFLDLDPVIPRVVAHSNETATPRNQALVGWLQNSQSIKSAIKAALPRDLYVQWKDTLMRSLHRRRKPLSPEVREDLYELYFKDDVARLKQIVDVDLSVWER